MKKLLSALLCLIALVACVPSAQADGYVAISDHEVSVTNGDYGTGYGSSVTGYWWGAVVYGGGGYSGYWTHQNWYSPDYPAGRGNAKWMAEKISGDWSKWYIYGDPVDGTVRTYPNFTTNFQVNHDTTPLNGIYTIVVKMHFYDENVNETGVGLFTLHVTVCNYNPWPFKTGCSDAR